MHNAVNHLSLFPLTFNHISHNKYLDFHIRTVILFFDKAFLLSYIYVHIYAYVLHTYMYAIHIMIGVPSAP